MNKKAASFEKKDKKYRNKNQIKILKNIKKSIFKLKKKTFFFLNPIFFKSQICKGTQTILRVIDSEFFIKTKFYK